LADPGHTHYTIRGLNRAFALSSIAFLGSVVWAMLADWSREWKGWQRAYQVEEADRAERALAETRTPEFQAEHDRISRELEQAKATLRDRAAEVEPLEKEWRKRVGEEYAADQAFRISRAEYQALLWRVQEERVRRGDPSYEAEALAKKAKEVDDERRAWEKAKAAREKAEEPYNKAVEARTRAERAKTELDGRLDPYLQKLELVRPTTLSKKALHAVRDFPGLDFMAPSLRVEKVVLEDLWFDLNFANTRKRRVDMCQTCHMPVDRTGWEAPDPKIPDSPAGKNPLKTHPRLDLFLSASAPHPKEKFGCTICHRGNGEALDFVRVDHSPGSDAQAREWEERRHWHKQHHWDFPMHPAPHVESGCVQCHKDTLETAGREAPTLRRGHELFERSGCYACHKLAWFPVTRKPGPTLSKLASKTTKDWAGGWLRNPKSFRPKTPMPRFFHLENQVSKAWDDNLIAAVAQYLFANAVPVELPAPPAGDAENGKKLFTVRGCLGCHEVSGIEGSGHDWSNFGPALDGAAGKLKPEWIFAWIQDPKSMWPETKMPDLRLTPEEAADVTAYLMTLAKAPERFRPGVPAVDRPTLVKQAVTFLASSRPLQEADDVAAGLARKDPEVLARLREQLQRPLASDDPLLEFVGHQLIQRQGCYSCHEIPGFERTQPIGVELTEWASKPFEQLDFGFLDREAPWRRWVARKAEIGEPVAPAIAARPALPPARHAWISQKLRAPRSYDFEKAREPLDVFRMPQFDFAEEEIRAIATFVLGFVKDEIPVAMKHRPAPRERLLEDGLAAVRRNNCAGCHVFRMEERTWRAEDGSTAVAYGRTSLDDADAKEIYFELWETWPGHKKTSEKVVIPYDRRIAQVPAEGGGILPALAKHFEEEKGWPPEEAPDKARVLSPPFLIREGWKVQPPWLFSFLKKPVTLRPWLEVRMPTFGFADAEARVLAEYFAADEDRNYGRTFSRNLREALGGTSVEALGREAKVAGAADQAARMLEALESSRFGAGDALRKLREFAARKGVALLPPPGLPFEHLVEREDAYLDERNRAYPGYLEGGGRLAGEKGFNCFKCHYRGNAKPPGEDPLAHAPDLARAKERLRPDWIRSWIEDAQRWVPGTSMPTFGNQKGFPELFHDAPIGVQLDAIKDYLLNLDRFPPVQVSSR
jgi:cbb3-type cytochrome oxidase cytochrome c subunit